MTTPDVEDGERNPLELGLFALGFIGFISFAFGIVILCADLALAGAFIFLCCVGCFYVQPE